jgi:hypothetical protein
MPKSQNSDTPQHAAINTQQHTEPRRLFFFGRDFGDGVTRPFKHDHYAWALRQNGIEVPGYTNAAEHPVLNWSNVEIRLYATGKISYSVADGQRMTSNLKMLGLIDGRSNQPNQLFGILFGLAHGRVFGAGEVVERKDKTRKARLCKALKQLTGMHGDPFLPRDKKGGYKPRFNLIDCRSDAAERAKRYAREEQFMETRDYAVEPDPADDWLNDNDQ